MSFSGGESSAYLLLKIWASKERFKKLLVIFANTSEENEETLEFVHKLETEYEIPIVWVEAKVHPKKGKVTGHTVVDFKTASRRGEIFEEVVKKYGIPNQSWKHCNRELKLRPIKSYAEEFFGGEEYWSAIGIRNDEVDRMSKDRIKLKLWYPLIEENPTTKLEINLFWNNHPFRLQLKGYEGNCKWCWKKSLNKLRMIAKESPKKFEFPLEMESKYPRIGHEFEKDPSAKDRTFFRGRRSAIDILEESKTFKGNIEDDSENYPEESCDIYSECGIDN